MQYRSGHIAGQHRHESQHMYLPDMQTGAQHGCTAARALMPTSVSPASSAMPVMTLLARMPVPSASGHAFTCAASQAWFPAACQPNLEDKQPCWKENTQAAFGVCVLVRV